jgi:hypothetical protein
MSEPEIKLGALTARLKVDAVWRDSYPAWQEYADECERLLSSLPDEQLKKFWPRLKAKRQQRDEALNEIRIAWFLESIGYRILDWNEPVDALGYATEYSISLTGQLRAFVEAKSPGWESELSDTERASGRAKGDKYLDEEEGRWADPVEVIRAAVKKARPKFSGKFPTIVFISDDCFVNIGEWGERPLKTALVEGTYGPPKRVPGMFSTSEYETVGAVCAFRVSSVHGPNGIDYECICEANPNALPTCSIPSDVAANLNKGGFLVRGSQS